jgi:hypothetical protein
VVATARSIRNQSSVFRELLAWFFVQRRLVNFAAKARRRFLRFDFSRFADLRFETSPSRLGEIDVSRPAFLYPLTLKKLSTVAKKMNITFSLHASARRLRTASFGSLLPVSGSLLPFQKFAIQLVFLCIRGRWSALSFWSARSRDRGGTGRVGQMSRRGAPLYVVSVQFLRRRLLRN